MAYQKHLLTDTIVAGADLSGLQNKVINIAGTLGTNETLAIGLLQNKPESGEYAEVCVMGIAKAIAAAAIAKGAALAVSSGYLITASSGDNHIGKAKVAANSGDTFTAYVNFINGASY